MYRMNTLTQALAQTKSVSEGVKEHKSVSSFELDSIEFHKYLANDGVSYIFATLRDSLRLILYVYSLRSVFTTPYSYLYANVVCIHSVVEQCMRAKT